MAEHIIQSLNSSPEFTKAQLVRIYEILSKLGNFERYSYNLQDSDLHEVFEYNSLITRQWGTNILSDKTFSLLKTFNERWQKYRKEKAYGDDEVFVFLDKEWRLIIENDLIPLLISFSSDFDLNKIKYVLFNKACVYIKPDDQEILERAQVLYELLLKNNIIERHYLT